jgi:hypothetical protein
VRNQRAATALPGGPTRVEPPGYTASWRGGTGLEPVTVVDSRNELFERVLGLVDWPPTGISNVRRPWRPPERRMQRITIAMQREVLLPFDKRDVVRAAAHPWEAELRHVVLPSANRADVV